MLARQLRQRTPGSRPENDALVSLQLFRGNFLCPNSAITRGLGTEKRDLPVMGQKRNRLGLLRQIEVRLQLRLRTAAAAHQMKDGRRRLVGQQAGRTVREVAQ